MSPARSLGLQRGVGYVRAVGSAGTRADALGVPLRRPAGRSVRAVGVWAWIAVLAGTGAGTALAAQRLVQPPPALPAEWILIAVALGIAGCLIVGVRPP